MDDETLETEARLTTQDCSNNESTEPKDIWVLRGESTDVNHLVNVTQQLDNENQLFCSALTALKVCYCALATYFIRGLLL